MNWNYEKLGNRFIDLPMYILNNYIYIYIYVYIYIYIYIYMIKHELKLWKMTENHFLKFLICRQVSIFLGQIFNITTQLKNIFLFNAKIKYFLSSFYRHFQFPWGNLWKQIVIFSSQI